MAAGWHVHGSWQAKQDFKQLRAQLAAANGTSSRVNQIIRIYCAAVHLWEASQDSEGPSASLQHCITALQQAIQVDMHVALNSNLLHTIMFHLLTPARNETQPTDVATQAATPEGVLRMHKQQAGIRVQESLLPLFTQHLCPIALYAAAVQAFDWGPLLQGALWTLLGPLASCQEAAENLLQQLLEPAPQLALPLLQCAAAQLTQTGTSGVQHTERKAERTIDQSQNARAAQSEQRESADSDVGTTSNVSDSKNSNESIPLLMCRAAVVTCAEQCLTESTTAAGEPLQALLQYTAFELQQGRLAEQLLHGDESVFSSTAVEAIAAGAKLLDEVLLAAQAPLLVSMGPLIHTITSALQQFLPALQQQLVVLQSAAQHTDQQSVLAGILSRLQSRLLLTTMMQPQLQVTGDVQGLLQGPSEGPSRGPQGPAADFSVTDSPGHSSVFSPRSLQHLGQIWSDLTSSISAASSRSASAGPGAPGGPPSRPPKPRLDATLEVQIGCQVLAACIPGLMPHNRLFAVGPLVAEKGPLEPCWWAPVRATCSAFALLQQILHRCGATSAAVTACLGWTAFHVEQLLHQEQQLALDLVPFHTNTTSALQITSPQNNICNLFHIICIPDTQNVREGWHIWHSMWAELQGGLGAEGAPGGPLQGALQAALVRMSNIATADVGGVGSNMYLQAPSAESRLLRGLLPLALLFPTVTLQHVVTSVLTQTMQVDLAVSVFSLLPWVTLPALPALPNLSILPNPSYSVSPYTTLHCPYTSTKPSLLLAAFTEGVFAAPQGKKTTEAAASLLEKLLETQVVHGNPLSQPLLHASSVLHFLAAPVLLSALSEALRILGAQPISGILQQQSHTKVPAFTGEQHQHVVEGQHEQQVTGEPQADVHQFADQQHGAEKQFGDQQSADKQQYAEQQPVVSKQQQLSLDMALSLLHTVVSAMSQGGSGLQQGPTQGPAGGPGAQGSVCEENVQQQDSEQILQCAGLLLQLLQELRASTGDGQTDTAAVQAAVDVGRCLSVVEDCAQLLLQKGYCSHTRQVRMRTMQLSTNLSQQPSRYVALLHLLAIQSVDGQTGRTQLAADFCPPLLRVKCQSIERAQELATAVYNGKPGYIVMAGFDSLKDAIAALEPSQVVCFANDAARDLLTLLGGPAHVANTALDALLSLALLTDGWTALILPAYSVPSALKRHNLHPSTPQKSSAHYATNMAVLPLMCLLASVRPSVSWEVLTIQAAALLPEMTRGEVLRLCCAGLPAVIHVLACVAYGFNTQMSGHGNIGKVQTHGNGKVQDGNGNGSVLSESATGFPTAFSELWSGSFVGVKQDGTRELVADGDAVGELQDGQTDGQMDEQTVACLAAHSSVLQLLLAVQHHLATGNGGTTKARDAAVLRVQQHMVSFCSALGKAVAQQVQQPGSSSAGRSSAIAAQMLLMRCFSALCQMRLAGIGASLRGGPAEGGPVGGALSGALQGPLQALLLQVLQWVQQGRMYTALGESANIVGWPSDELLRQWVENQTEALPESMRGLLVRICAGRKQGKGGG